MIFVSKKEGLMICLGGACSFIIIVSLLVGYIVWLVYSIVGLTEVSDKTIREHCGSLLWRYVLVMCILILFTHNVKSSKKDENEESLCNYVINYLITIAMSIWGAYELWGRESCINSLEKYTIYTTAYIITVYQFVVIGIVPIAFIVSIINTNDKPEKSNSDSPSNIGV